MTASAVAAETLSVATPSVAGSLLTTMFSLILVLALIFALAWILRWMQGHRVGGTGALRIHSGLQVGPKERILHVQAGEQHLLIGVAPGRVQTLHVFEQPPADLPLTADNVSPFAEKLRQLLQKRTSLP